MGYYKKEQSSLDVLTEALISAGNLQKLLDAPRNAKINNLGAQYKQLETAFNLAQTDDDIANLNNRKNDINKENIYPEIALFKDIVNMQHRGKAEQYRNFEDSMKNISTIISGPDFPQTQEDYGATMSDWAEVYQLENPNDNRPVMKSILKNYKEFQSNLSGIMAEDANNNWSLINPNFKYNKSGSGLKDNEMLEQYIKYGQRLENYLGHSLEDDTISDIELMTGMEEELENWYNKKYEDIKTQSGKDINYHMRQIDTLNTWLDKKEPEDSIYTYSGQMSGTEIGESLGITDDMDMDDAKTKITNQINYHEWAINESKKQVYKWGGKPIDEYVTSTSGMYGEFQRRLLEDSLGGDFDINDDGETSENEINFLNKANMQDIQEKVDANINAQNNDEKLPFSEYGTDLNTAIQFEYNAYDFTNDKSVDADSTWGQFLTKYSSIFNPTRDPGAEIVKTGGLGAIVFSSPEYIKKLNESPEDLFEFEIAQERKQEKWLPGERTIKIAEQTDAYLMQGLGLNKLDTKLVNQTIDQIIKDSPNLKGTELQNKVRQTLMKLESSLTTTGLHKNFSNPDFQSIDQIVRYRTGEVKEPKKAPKTKKSPSKEQLTNSTKDLIGNKIPLYDKNGNFNPKFAEKVPKINVLFDSRTKKFATLADGSLYIMDSQRIPSKSILKELGIRLPKGISPDAIKGEEFVAAKRFWTGLWKKYPHLRVKELDMKTFGENYSDINMLESNKGRFKGIKNLSLYGNQYAEDMSPQKWKKLKGAGKFAKGFVVYNALTALSGNVVEGLTDSETAGQIAAQGTMVALDVAALTKSPKFLKHYRKTVNKAFKEASEQFIKSTTATKAAKKQFINMAEKVGKSKTTKFAMAFAKKLGSRKVRNMFMKSVAFKLTAGLLAKVGITASTAGTVGAVAAVAWTAYDVYELGYMIYNVYKDVEGEQEALEEWNKATK